MAAPKMDQDNLNRINAELYDDITKFIREKIGQGEGPDIQAVGYLAKEKFFPEISKLNKSTASHDEVAQKIVFDVVNELIRQAGLAKAERQEQLNKIEAGNRGANLSGAALKEEVQRQREQTAQAAAEPTQPLASASVRVVGRRGAPPEPNVVTIPSLDTSEADFPKAGPKEQVLQALKSVEDIKAHFLEYVNKSTGLNLTIDQLTTANGVNGYKFESDGKSARLSFPGEMIASKWIDAAAGPEHGLIAKAAPEAPSLKI